MREAVASPSAMREAVASPSAMREAVASPSAMREAVASPSAMHFTICDAFCKKWKKGVWHRHVFLRIVYKLLNIMTYDQRTR